ncbi:SIR2 family protein [Weissella paramesenteroides]|uniref:SIR2 family protein n=1 Tax=Weissella paramesenteroides TaxID=1249 RepID=UPI00207320AE|nr:SIR2 family protein [Weissella paramesenteroides]MCM6765396.1 SIR2 family protein [Weissella paramesenteroides]MCM6766767.1 SIR2 family protein [Weissella paramesenteroides]MCM6771469.1 SIR2 family protein [Weissella paramesenteroides]MCM6779438.1 SIR2 family protein [Weissella paramesenteroides]MCM6782021.1 SIR2 family protein [Weissella paramesenteroides]
MDRPNYSNDLTYRTIALALLENRLTFLWGTGMSKFLTENQEKCSVGFQTKSDAPSFIELIDYIDQNLENTLKQDFDNDLIKAASILEIEANQCRKDFKKIVRDIIIEHTNTINNENLKYINDLLQQILELNPNFNPKFITTNYDHIIEDNILNKFNNKKLNKVQHIHGDIEDPNSIIITVKDYYRDFDSKEVISALDNDIVLIMGYSLSDFDINKYFIEWMKENGNKTVHSYIYYFLPDNIVGTIKDNEKEFYRNTFGIHVINNSDMQTFFKKISEAILSNEFSLGNESDYKPEQYSEEPDLFNQVVLTMSLEHDLSRSENIDKLLNDLDLFTNYCMNHSFSDYVTLAHNLFTFLKYISFENLSTNQTKKLEKLVTFSLDHTGYNYGKSWNSVYAWQNNNIKDKKTLQFLKSIPNYESIMDLRH